MDGIYMSRHKINVLENPNAPEIHLAYFKGEHPENAWQYPLDLKMCKINFFVEGDAYIISNDKSFSISSGDIAVFRPHDIHYGKIPYKQYIEYYQIEFEPQALSVLNGGSDFIKLFSSDCFKNITQLHISANYKKSIKQNFEKLFALLKGEDFAKNIKALAVLIKILSQINDCKDFSVNPVENERYPEVLLNALQFISRNYQSPITTSGISEAVFVSRSYLNDLFQKYLNCSVYQYVLSLRISKSANLLCDGLSVTETALSVGFQSSSSFASNFKKVYKMSPSKFSSVYCKNAQKR